MLLKIKKALSRLQMIFNEFFIKCHFFTFKYALDSTLWWLAYYSVSEGKLTNFFWRKKHKYIVKWLEQNCPSTWTWLRDNKDVITNSPLVSSYHIWVFWYQGMEHAPTIVKTCYTQLCTTCGKTVHLVTKDNINDYTSFPLYIIDKVKNKQITLTHFSDILRVSLLSQYGGIWIDATCWVSKPNPTWTKHQPFYSCKINDKSLWRGWLMGSSIVNYPLFIFVQKVLFEYWSKHNVLIDYLLIDHLLQISFDSIQQVHLDMIKLPVNNTHRSELYNYLASPWNKDLYNVISADTWCFKLSWKTYFPYKTLDGKQTFFGWMCEQSKVNH